MSPVTRTVGPLLLLALVSTSCSGHRNEVGPGDSAKRFNTLLSESGVSVPVSVPLLKRLASESKPAVRLEYVDADDDQAVDDNQVTVITLTDNQPPLCYRFSAAGFEASNGSCTPSR